MNKTRTLKISYITRDIKKSKVPEYDPKIILQGQWLEQAGFRIGEQTTVFVSDGMIQIINNTKV